jgi:recombination protein RecA|tara:strand:+ start:1661 stop:2770 length:1110 start_codon:yes stop_codon:yes gene_type:complete
MAKKEAPKSVTLEDLKNKIEKDHGAGAVMLGKNAIVDVDVFPTGIITVDSALGVGGIPRGRIIELYGPESSGKTTTALQIIASCQQFYFENKKRNGACAFIDAEHALDPNWADKIGVDMEHLLISQPDNGEQALTIVEAIAESGLVDLIVVDSVAALIPKKMLDGELGANTIGAQAQLMSKALNRLKSKCAKTATTVIFINQIRMKIGVMFGSPEDTPGGRALKFYSSVRMDVRKIGTLKVDSTPVANRTRMKIVKNKVAAPFQEAEYEICFGKEERPTYGIDTFAAILDAASDEDVVTVKGSHYSFNGIKLGNGKVSALQYLEDNEIVAMEIKDKTYGKLMLEKSEPLIDREIEDVLDSYVDEKDADS